MRYSEFMKKRVAGAEKGLPFGPDDKTAAREFATSVGVDQPRLLAMSTSIDGLDFAALPDRFALKPDGLHSGHGVHLLTRSGDGQFLDQRSGETISLELLRPEYERLRQRLKVPERFKVMVEEWVSGEDGAIGPIPPDYKVYVFYGRPKLILQVNRNVTPTGLGWFDGNFRPLRISDCFDAIPDIYQPDRLELPRRWKDLLRMARTMSVAMRVPFARVDLYASDRGPLLGEVTLTPGGAGYSYPFTARFDQKLGKAWERAVHRIERDKASGKGGRSAERLESARPAPDGRRPGRRRRSATGPSGGARTRTP